MHKLRVCEPPVYHRDSYCNIVFILFFYNMCVQFFPRDVCYVERAPAAGQTAAATSLYYYNIMYDDDTIII